jgi:hypothetical protein
MKQIVNEQQLAHLLKDVGIGSNSGLQTDLRIASVGIRQNLSMSFDRRLKLTPGIN